MLDSRLSKIQMPTVKVMNKIPSGMLKKIFKDNKESFPVALQNNRSNSNSHRSNLTILSDDLPTYGGDMDDK